MMKRILALFLALLMALSLVGCGDTTTNTPATPESTPEPALETTYNFGDSITTSSGMYIFTPTFDGFASALANWPDKNYLHPDGKGVDESNNPFVANDGKVMMYYSAKVEYIGNSKSNESFGFSAKVDYDDGYIFNAKGMRYSSDGEDWDSGYDNTTFEPLSNDTVRIVRFCVEVPEVVETDSEKRTVTIFSIEGQEYTFLVDTKAAADAKAKAEAAAEAEKIEKMTEVDATLAQEIKGKLQGTWSWSVYGYAADKLYSTSHDLTFSGDGISLQTQNTLLNSTMSNTGTYYVAKAYIVLNFADGAQACIPYTYENGEINMSQEIEGAFYTVA